MQSENTLNCTLSYQIQGRSKQKHDDFSIVKYFTAILWRITVTLYFSTDIGCKWKGTDVL